MHNFAAQNHRVPWPSGEASVCKTEHSSSILLGTSKKIYVNYDIDFLFTYRSL